MKRNLLVTALVVSCCTCLFAAEKSDVTIHTPDEVFKTAVDSKLTYELELAEKDFVTPEKGRIITPWVQIDTDNGWPAVVEHEPSGEAMKAFEEGEQAFSEKKYTIALKKYDEVRALDPEFKSIYNYLGDAYYMMQDYKKAKTMFEYGIKINPANYQTHWFLADTYRELGEPEKALREITTAHLLNVNHPQLKETLEYYRKYAGKPWKNWSYTPQVEITKTGDAKIRIKTTANWLGYGMAKAIWKYEPGYAEATGGTDPTKAFYSEEGEAFLCMLSKDNSNAHLVKIMNDDKFLELIGYEVLAKKQPEAMLMLTKEKFNGIIDYINTYH